MNHRLPHAGPAACTAKSWRASDTPDVKSRSSTYAVVAPPVQIKTLTSYGLPACTYRPALPRPRLATPTVAPAADPEPIAMFMLAWPANDEPLCSPVPQPVQPEGDVTVAHVGTADVPDVNTGEYSISAKKPRGACAKP